MTHFSTRAAVLVAMLAGLSGAAAAQEASYEYPQAVASTLTRADVQTQLMQARAAGTLLVSEFDRQANDAFVPARSRADVRAETLAASARGELRRGTAEDYGQEAVPGHAAPVARIVAVAR
jgi:hypothetical protein